MRTREETSITDPIARHGRRSVGRRSWLDRWMAALRTVGNVQAWILLTVFYVLIITPMGLVFRFVADPLRLRKRAGSNWQPFSRHYDRMAEALEQF